MGPGRLNIQGQAVDHTEVWNPGHKQAMWGEQNGVGLAYVCGQSPGQAACKNATGRLEYINQNNWA